MKNLLIFLFLLFETQIVIAQMDSKKKLEKDSCCCCDDDTTILCITSKNDSDKYNIPKHYYTVLYDFKTGNIAFPKTNRVQGDYLRRGDAIKVKIVNFNRFLYQANVNSKDTTHNAVVDNSSNIFSSGFTSLTSLVSNLAAVTAAAATSQSQTASEFMNAIKVLSLGKEPKNSNRNVSGNNQTNAQNDSSRLAILFQKNIGKIRNYDTLIHDLKDKVDSLTSYGWSTLMKVLRDPYPTCNSFTILGNDIIKNKIVLQFDTEKKKIHDKLNKLKSSRYEYLDESAKYTDLIRATGTNNNRVADSLIKSYYTETLSYLTKVDSIMSYKNLQTLTEPFDKMKGAKPCYTSEPIFLLGDSKIINLQIKPWSDSLHLPPPQNITFELPWTQRHIWGVTGGIYIGGLHNESYAGRFDSTTTTVNGISTTVKGYSLNSDNTAKMEFGVNLLAYSDWKLKDDNKNLWYGGVVFGAGSSLESKPKPRFFLGGNLINGTNNRIMISGGVSGGYVDRLSSAYHEGSPLYTAIPTGYIKDVLRVNWFLSISYSFLNK